LIYQLVKIESLSPAVINSGTRSIRIILILGILTSLLQMVWGTQVREEIDLISKSFHHVQRDKWIQNLNTEFFIHRSFSWVVVFLNILLVYFIYKNYKNISLFRNLGNGIFTLVIAEIVAGVVLAYFSIPAVIQPVHLFLAFLIFGFQFFFLLVINFKKSQVNISKQT
jgi:cytochrome c oxidase assembly protein subunit 15